MLKELLKLFEKAYKNKDIEMMLGSHVLTQGLYIRINENFVMDKENIMIIDNKGEIQEGLVESYQWFKCRDYYSSKLPGTENYIDQTTKDGTKAKVLSNNYLSFFIKQKFLPSYIQIDTKLKNKYNTSNDYFIKIVENYYLNLKNPRKSKDSNKKNNNNTKLIFDNLVNDGYKVDDLDNEQIDKYKNFILYNITDIECIVKKYKLKKEDYIKIFFDTDVKKYYDTYQVYMKPRIFNDNDYNILDNKNIILGVSNCNMTLNSDKPYKKMLVSKFINPDMVSLNDAILINNMNEWIKNKCKEGNYYTPYISFEMNNNSFMNNGNLNIFSTDNHDTEFEGVYLSLHYKDKYINDFDYIPKFNKYIDYPSIDIFQEEIIFNKKDIKINTLSRLEWIFSRNFFEGKMKGNFIDADFKLEVDNNKIKNIFNLNRNILYDFFRKGQVFRISSIIKNLLLQLIIEKIVISEDVRTKELKEIYNFRLSFLEFFQKGGYKLADRMKVMMQTILNKLNKEGQEFCETDDEFYFLSGQMAYYLVSQSEAQSISGRLIEPFIKVKDGIMLKNKLKEAYKKYGYKIYLNNGRFRKAFSMLEGYFPETNLNDNYNQDMFIAGVFSENFIWGKKK